MNKIVFYKKLRSIIQKIIHRCNPSDYNTFEDLLRDINGSVFDEDHGSTFLTDDEVNWINSDIEIKENIIELCLIHAQENKNNIDGTIESLLTELDLIYQPEAKILNISFDFKNLSYLKEHTMELSDLIESQLLMNDLSVLPYKK